MRTFLISLFILVSGSASTYTISSPVPYQYSSFKTISTEHFDIHYPSKSSEDFFEAERIEQIAKLSANYLEEAFYKLTKELNSTPYLKIQVVLIDNTDSHNGFASPVPQNTIYVYTVPPLPHSSIAEYDNWLRDTIFHELTHIINLSTTRGYSVPLRAIFGTIASINGLAPLNIVEGYAVFEETNMTTKGRGRSTYLSTLLRTATYNNKLTNEGIYDLATAPYMIDEWPLGNRPYLYGYLLFEHVALNYGMDVPGKISKHNAGVVPYFPSMSFKKYTGKSIDGLWNDTLREKNKFYSEWIEKIKKEPSSNMKTKFNDGFVTRLPAISPDGKHIAYYNMGPDKRNAIVISELDTGKEIKRLRSDEASFIKWLDNETIIYNRLWQYVSGYYYRTKTYKIGDEITKHVDESQRLMYMDVMDNNELCTVRARTGYMTIGLEKLEDKELKPYKKLYDSELLSRISYINCTASKDTIQTYFIEKEINKDEQIIALNDSGIKEVLHSSKGSIKDLSISRDKKSLLFIDDKDGIFNVYRLELATGKTVKLSNLITGAFNVVDSTEANKAYISYYTGNGFSLTHLELTQNNKEQAKPVLFPIRVLPYSENIDEETLNKKTYSPIKTLLPKFWIPSFSFLEGGYSVGAMTYGADALFRNQYTLSGAYDSRTKKPAFGVSYSNQSFYPRFSFSMYSDNTWYATSQIIQDLDSDIRITIPINNWWSTYTGLSYSYRTLDFMNRRTKRLGPVIGISFNEAYSTLSKISSAEMGSSGYLTYRLYQKNFGSSYDEYQIDANIKFFIPLWWKHHVLAINNDIGYTYGNPNAFFVVGGEQSSFIIGSKKYMMRGYPISYMATQTLLISNIEYRFPIFTVNDGPALAPFFFKKIHGALISDQGWATRGLKRRMQSYGAELRTSGDIFYHLPLTLRLGLYKAPGEPKGQLFIGISSVF